MNKQDKEIIRNLAGQAAEIAALPIQEEKRRLWRNLNSLKPDRPMVMIDQVCWNEMNVDNILTLQCEDPLLREWEQTLRKQLYQWRHFPVDAVIEDFFQIPKAVEGMHLGVDHQEQVLWNNENTDVASHKYINQFTCMDDVEKVKMPIISHNEIETNRRLALAEEVFDGLLKIKLDGWDPYLSVWDPISAWMSVEDALYGLVDEPEMMLALAKRIVSGYMTGLDQMEQQGLLCAPQSLIHCTGAWTDELPQGKATESCTTKDIWMFGLAQMFSTVSPDMFNEYEIDICMPLFERFGMVYYGCCDPLDRKMDQVKRIPNLRKISISPWADTSRGAEAIGKDYVLSYKPNPAYLASFDEGIIRNDIRETVQICKKYGCPLELILKDISTVGGSPERLWRWAEIAMEEVQ